MGYQHSSPLLLLTQMDSGSFELFLVLLRGAGWLALSFFQIPLLSFAPRDAERARLSSLSGCLSFPLE